MGKLLEVKNLKVQFETSDGIVKALNGIDISLDEGMTLGLVGETGAGKTTLAKSIMRICSTATRENCFGRDPV